MNRPALDPRSLQDALDAVYTANPVHPGHPLLAFLLVRRHMEQPVALAGEHAALQAIRHVLKECLTEVLGERIGTNTAQQIEHDFQQENAYLESFSLLYYRYLRPDLQLTMEQISTWAKMAVRSLQRRQHEGLGYLVQVLIDREMHLRQAEQVLHLQLRIPYAGHRSLYGREWLVERIIASLPHAPVLVSGVEGIGKRLLVATACHQLVHQLDDLVWIKGGQPDLISAILQAVGKGLDGYSLRDLAAYCLQKRVLFVLEVFAAEMQPLLEQTFIQHSLLIAISAAPMPDWTGITLEVPALSYAAAHQFFEDHRGDLDSDLFTRLPAAEQGIPGRLMALMRLYRVQQGHQSLSQTYFTELWEKASEEMRQAWLLGSLRDLRLPASMFLGLNDALIETMLEQGILVQADAALQLTEAAAYFIQSRPDIVQAVDFASIVQHFLGTSTQRDQVFFFCLELLTAGWLQWLKGDQRMALLNACAMQIALKGGWAEWAQVLQRIKAHLPDTPYWRGWQDLEQARWLRWQGQFAEDVKRLQEIIQRAGTLGFFDIYARALLEFGLVASYREHPAALEACTDAEATFQRLQMPFGVQLARLTHARLLLRSQPEQALHLATEMELPIAATVACEAALILERWQAAIHHASATLEQTPAQSAVYGRALSLMARALWHASDLLLALDYQQQAINILSMGADLVGLTRALNNLGVIYDALGERHKAKEAWEATLKLCLGLQDAAALEIIRHNLAVRFEHYKPRLL